MASTSLVDKAVPPRGPMLPPLLILFFVGGACGAISGQLWLRQWSLVFGVTAPATVTVLAAFLSGLALGGVLGGRYADRTDRPLEGYALVGVLLGVVALATPFALKPVERFYVDLARQLPDSTAVLTLARFGLSFGLLAVPAGLMGAGLPIVVKSSVARSGRLAERFSLLYATATAGAVVGVLAGGFWLTGRYGVAGSFRLAAAGNVVVGVVAWVLSSVWERGRQVVPLAPTRAEISSSQIHPETERVRKLVLIVCTVIGLAAAALGVLWFRMLALYAEHSSYALAVMLATALGGIAAGSTVASLLVRWFRRSLVPLTVAVLVVAPAALSSVYFLTKTYTFADRFRGLVPSVDPGASRFVFVTSALTVLPTTVLMGLALAIGLRAWTGEPQHAPREAGQRVGVFYACTVAGGMVGVLLSGLGLVPLLGARRSVVVIAALVLISGVVLATMAAGRMRFAIAGGAITLFLLGAQVSVPDPYRVALRHRHPGQRVRWLDEDALTTVSINERRDGTRVMYVNGVQRATDNPLEASGYKLAAALPMALHVKPRRALVIGLGGGVVAGAVSAYPGVTVDVVEPSRAVVQGAKYLSAVNGSVVARDNVRIRIDDGRSYMRVSENLYDVISADYTPPDEAGASRVWSIEYWEAARDALADGGIMLQWLPYDGSQAEYDMVVHSFLRVFPNATMWANGTVLLGTKEQLFIDSRVITLKLAAPETRLFLAGSGIGGLDAITFRYTAGPEAIRAAIGENGPLLTDDRPRIEYFRSLPVDPRPVDTTRIKSDDSEIVRG